jgi:hypothetical protein
MRDTRDRLIAHVGGSRSAVELALIERAAQLTLKAALLDGQKDIIRYRDPQVGHGPAFHRHACALGLKGTASKYSSAIALGAIFLIACGRTVRCRIFTYSTGIEFQRLCRALSVPIPSRAIPFGSKFGSKVFAPF